MAEMEGVHMTLGLVPTVLPEQDICMYETGLMPG